MFLAMLPLTIVNIAVAVLVNPLPMAFCFARQLAFINGTISVYHFSSYSVVIRPQSFKFCTCCKVVDAFSLFFTIVVFAPVYVSV